MIRRVALAFSLVCLTVSAARAQHPWPYRWEHARPLCHQNPYVVPIQRSCEVLPAMINPFVVSTVVQGSVGQPGRELVFVVLLNLTDQPQEAVVEYAIDGRLTPDGLQDPYIHTVTLGPKQRLSIGLHNEPAVFGGRPIYLSVSAYFSAPGAFEMVWHRASDLGEAISKPGTVVPRQAETQGTP